MCNLIDVDIIPLDEPYVWASFSIAGRPLGGRLWCLDRAYVVDVAENLAAQAYGPLCVTGLSAKIAAARGPYYDSDNHAYRTCLSILKDRVDALAQTRHV